MKKILNFLEQLKFEKESAFNEVIENFSRKNNENDWNGNQLEIVEKNDIFLYISEDKKSINRTIGEYDPRIAFSYLICFCHVDYCAKYVNGGLHLIGFYDSDFCKVTDITFKSFKIKEFNGGFSFVGRENPDFSFKLLHEEGIEVSSFRGNPYFIKTCQGVIDSVWELETFYEKWYNELNDFQHDWTERLVRTPKSLI